MNARKRGGRHVGVPKLTKMASPEKGKHEELISVSDYAKKLEHHVRQGYLDKISVIGIDHVLTECLTPVEAADLLSYLVLDTSYYTSSQFKTFRSLNAYNQMISGFITSVQGQIIAKKYLVCAKVRHSQRMNDPPVPLWIITGKDGTAVCSHCTGCMAGLGECCSHVASLFGGLDPVKLAHR